MVNDIGETQIHQLTNDIWNSMLGIELGPSQSSPFNCSKVSSCVQIVGEWEGAVRLDITTDLARAAAAAFLGTEVDEIGAEQIRDAVGELANMTAGSLKTLLPKPCKLSLPSVAAGKDFELTIQHGKLALRSVFESCSQPGHLMVSILERVE